MSLHAAGPFEVTMNPQPPYSTDNEVTLARASLTKRYQGDLEGTSTMEMLSAVTSVKGSAGYVGIERFTGALHGRTGGFVLQHSGLMTRGVASLAVSVVPDSGTGDLKGLAGQLKIDIVEGAHRYALDYTLATAD